MVGTAPFTWLHTRWARLPAILLAFLVTTPLPARLGTFRIALVIRGTSEATQVSALERSFAGMTFVMRADRKKSARIRGCIITRNLLALVASRFTRPAAARGEASATSHDAAMFAAW